jgi:hypothetical protein
MITPAEIREKAEKKYTAFLRAWLGNESFFPLRIPGRLASGSTPWDQLSPWIKQLNASSRTAKGHGYTVHFGEPITTRQHGRQTLPEAITIETQADFLGFIHKVKEFQQFVAEVGFLRAALPQLETWMQNRPQAVIDHAGSWPELVAVCNFLLGNHNKFIEQNKGILRELLDQVLDAEYFAADASVFEDRFGLRKPPITFRFRVLDACLQAALHLPASDVSIPLEDFARLPLQRPRVVVCENLMPFLTMPGIAQGLCIFGEGNAVSALVAPWLADAEIVYWGDLDIQGFRFLAHLRRRYPQVQSMFMDAATLEKYRAFAGTGVADGSTDPDGLTDAEQAAYTILKQGNLRLEQERILHADVVAQLQAMYPNS